MGCSDESAGHILGWIYLRDDPRRGEAEARGQAWRRWREGGCGRMLCGCGEHQGFRRYSSPVRGLVQVKDSEMRWHLGRERVVREK